ncbi:aldose 1-epimerase [Nakamurella panacisegetis]|uniref:Aldose 1-epimerase n=1 Tax=Nakamurella panacisegetis TaxID=1090615 RepID=A0A1H0J286_9ACTN|nr:aldose 1-epimerase family protein [Nakamurella panacisegetis]SDO37653.1 aldose 1-epimerase [Nakamurella panacisegetis]
MTAPRAVSGRQFELRRGDAFARIGQVAAVLREFSVGGVQFTETWADDLVAPMGCGLVLAPWPNRVAGGAWALHGVAQQLDITEPSRGNAIHGLLRNAVYEVLGQTESSVTIGASIYPQHGYPFILDTSVTYELTDHGLQVTHRLTNAGTAAAPFGIGAHPYLRVGDVPAADLTVTVSGRTHARVDGTTMIPIALEPVEGTHVDLRSGMRVGDLRADVALTDFDVVDGGVAHRLSAPDGTSLVLWADEVFGWVQVFSPHQFPVPGRADQRVAIAIEPMTCAVDAFNSGRGLQWLEPGAQWSASWGLRPEGF